MGTAAGSGGASSVRAGPEPSGRAGSVSASDARFSSLGTGLPSAGSCCVSLTGAVSGGFFVACFFFKEGGLGFLVRLRVLESLLDPVPLASGAGAAASVLPGQDTPSKSPACRLRERDSADLEGGTESVDFLRALALHSGLLGSEGRGSKAWNVSTSSMLSKSRLYVPLLAMGLSSSKTAEKEWVGGRKGLPSAEARRGPSGTETSSAPHPEDTRQSSHVRTRGTSQARPPPSEQSPRQPARALGTNPALTHNSSGPGTGLPSAPSSGTRSDGLVRNSSAMQSSDAFTRGPAGATYHSGCWRFNREQNQPTLVLLELMHFREKTDKQQINKENVLSCVLRTGLGISK